MVTTALAILLLPLIAFLIVVFITWRQKPLSAWVTIVAIGMTTEITKAGTIRTTRMRTGIPTTTVSGPGGLILTAATNT